MNDEEIRKAVREEMGFTPQLTFALWFTFAMMGLVFLGASIRVDAQAIDQIKRVIELVLVYVVIAAVIAFWARRTLRYRYSTLFLFCLIPILSWAYLAYAVPQHKRKAAASKANRIVLIRSNGTTSQPLQLERADLAGVDLRNVNLQFAQLTGANLSGANLSGANLVGAKLLGANLTRANLTGANMTRADLFGAKVSGAIMVSANLAHADLRCASLSRADLSGADQSGAIRL